MSNPFSRKPNSPSSQHAPHRLGRHITLAKMQRVRQWHVSQQAVHPLEYHAWDAVLTLWMMGWIAWLPAYALDAFWAYPLCLLGIFLPRLYVHYRTQAHKTLRLRCDWLDLVCE